MLSDAAEAGPPERFAYEAFHLGRAFTARRAPLNSTGRVHRERSDLLDRRSDVGGVEPTGKDHRHTPGHPPGDLPVGGMAGPKMMDVLNEKGVRFVPRGGKVRDVVRELQE